MVLYKNIFLADDDPDDRYLFTEALHEIDETINCEFADDGNKTLEILKLSPSLPDVIFLDLNMPTMDGLQCLSKIRSDIRLTSLPVVIFTTSQNPDDVETTHRLGANVYFMKPANFEELKSKLEKILNLNFQASNPKMDVILQYAV